MDIKRYNPFLTTLVLASVVSLCSCSKERQGEDFSNRHVIFGSSIVDRNQTKASGTTWANDEIGVYMVAAGEALSFSNAVAINKKYSTPGTGLFQPATVDHAIYFPYNGERVDFIAYYPYIQTITDNTLAINVSDQSNPAVIDLLYSNQTKNLNKTATAVNLGFSHMLTNIVLDITNLGNNPLTGLEVTISGMKTQSAISLVDGSLTDIAASVGDIEAITSVTGSTAQSEAIVLPISGLTGAKIKFSITPLGKFYEWIIPAGQNYLGKYRYTYQIRLKEETLEVVNPSGTISPWLDFDHATTPIELDPIERVEFYCETMGVGIYANSSSRKKVGAFTDWDEKTITYSDEFNSADIRSVAPLSAHVWFPAEVSSQLKIVGLPVGYKDIILSYDIACEQASYNANRIKIKSNGSLNEQQPKETVVGTQFKTISVSVPDNTTSIELCIAAADNPKDWGFRLDNIKLTGIHISAGKR